MDSIWWIRVDIGRSTNPRIDTSIDDHKPKFSKFPYYRSMLGTSGQYLSCDPNSRFSVKVQWSW